MVGKANGPTRSLRSEPFLLEKNAPRASALRKQYEWSIGIYVGDAPLHLTSEGVNNPVLTRNDVSDVRAAFVADPFMVRRNSTWYMFFEVMNCQTAKGEIGLATSEDGFKWIYQKIVLAEPFHISYPYVFEWKNDYYMIPETYRASSIRLYKAKKFPAEWSCVATLVSGPRFADSSIVHYAGKWWLFTETDLKMQFDTLRLYYADDLMGPWLEHSKSPIIEGNPSIARPAGRILALGDKIFRYAQDCYPDYGTQVRAFEITELTVKTYREHEMAGSPILMGSGAGWNRDGMHHIDPHLVESGRWIACVDGWVCVGVENEERAESSENGSIEGRLKSRLVRRAKSYLENYKLYNFARDVKWAIESRLKKADEPKVFSLVPERPAQGNVLLSYRQALEAFTRSQDQPIPNTHTNYWASMQMAKTFRDLGYCVDIISHDDDKFLPKKDYSICVDVRWNLERLAPLLNRDCIKVMHLDAAHMLFHNAAECRRLLELQQRKGVTLRPRRLEVPNLGIEHADYATTTGNSFTISTFRYANKPIYRIPIAAAVSCPWPEEKDWEACRKRFLWFSSGGLVHKGLDLALEAFAEMPECHLTVCAPINQEADFARTYYKELYRTPNIETIGWVDVGSRKFTEIANTCIGLIYTSCSEGGGACAITCMHAALIPIVGYETSVDVHDFGVPLRSCSVEDIQDSIRMVAHRPAEELKEMARKAWEYARANHTREKFADEYRNVITKILATHHQAVPLDSVYEKSTQ